MNYLVVTGTDTGVGKTVVAASLAVAQAPDVALVKPVQTGVSGDAPGDVHEAARLSGVATSYELVRLAEPLAPETAARRAGILLPPVAELAARIAEIRAATVIVEGSGGVRVRLDTDGGTILDLAAILAAHGAVEVVVVTRAGLGTLNATELTVDAVRTAGLPVGGVVIGSWPTHPDLASHTNREDLPRLTGVPLLGTLPQGCGSWTPAAFRAAAGEWLVGYAAPP